jgi:hypothetical protein
LFPGPTFATSRISRKAQQRANWQVQTPGSSGDLSGLALDSQDANALRQCKIGSRATKVPITAIQQLARTPQIPQQRFLTRANSVLRDELLKYIQRYLSLGDQELIEYHDKDKPVLLSDQCHSLLTGWSSLHELVPEFCDLLTRGPEQPLPFLEEFLYWSKESFGLKPVISVTHATIIGFLARYGSPPNPSTPAITLMLHSRSH